MLSISFLKILLSLIALMVDTKSALVAQTTTPMESVIEGDASTTTTATTKDTQRTIETITQGSNAVLTIQLSAADATEAPVEASHDISCTVTLAGVTRNLGNWTETRTPVLQLSPVMQEIFGHRLTVSFQKSVVSVSLVNVTFSDSGIYSCASRDTQKTDIDLRVTGGPFIVSRNFPDSVTIKEGETSTLETIACGNPKPSVKWTLTNGTVPVEGIVMEGTYGYRSEHITQKFGLSTYCYKYTYETPKVYREPCSLSGNYQVSGDSVNPISGTVAISVSFIPERVTDVRSKIMEGEQCMVTRWNGPLLNPNHCRTKIDYHVEVVRKTLSPVVFMTYSNNFMVCRDDLGVTSMGDVLGVRVRYANDFGHGEYVNANFVTDFAKKVEVVSLVEPAQNDDDNYRNIAITTSGLLGLFVLVIIVFITYYACVNWNGTSCCCCPCINSSGSSVEDGLTTIDNGSKTDIKKKIRKYTISRKRDQNQTTIPDTPTSSKTPRKSRIRKETIIPKPKSLAQVTAQGIGIHKSATFSGYDSFQNPHATEAEETLQKGYMPLNTLQRRISESLAAAQNAPQNRVSTIPVFEDIFENSHTEVTDDDSEVDDDIYNEDDDGKRNSGASAETECTSLGSRTTLDNIGHHATLHHTHSLESAASDFDMPYVIDLDKGSAVSTSRRKQSLYDQIPRSQTFHGGVRPNRFNPTSSDDGVSQKSEYAHPSVAFRNKDFTDTLPKSLRDKRKSVYHTPRKSMLQLNVEDLNDGYGEELPKKKSSYTDDKVIYDRPKQVLPQPQEPQLGTPTANTASSKPEEFAAPVISQITGLYDTPRIHATPVAEQQPAEQPKETPPTNSTPSESGNTLETPSNVPNETLYDNINFILTKYGCSDTASPASDTNNDKQPSASADTPSQNIYDQLPLMTKGVDAERTVKRGTEC